VPALAGGPSALLPSARDVPRELVPDEIRGLLAAASHEVRVAALLLLSGLGPDEALALRWDDVDLATRRIRVSGDTARSIEIVEPLLGLLQRSPHGPDARVLAVAGEAPPNVETLASQLLYAAHDGGLDRAAEVTPDALWHTGIAYLARQGIRLAELAKVAGRLSAEQAATYSALAPAGTRVSLAEVHSILQQVQESSPG
jgi:integrase